MYVNVQSICTFVHIYFPYSSGENDVIRRLFTDDGGSENIQP